MRAIELFNLNILRAEKLIDLHKRAFKRGRPVAEGEAADLLRSAIVFAEAALDTYIHVRTVEVTMKIIFKGKKVPHAVAQLIASPIKESDRSKALLNIAVAKNPESEIRKLLRKQLSYQTFQAPKDLDEAFRMMEIGDSWKKLDKFLTNRPGPKKQGKKQTTKIFLLNLSERRNDIVHRGDMYINKKYHGKYQIISRSQVADSLVKLKKIVFGIEQISERKS